MIEKYNIKLVSFTFYRYNESRNHLKGEIKLVRTKGKMQPIKQKTMINDIKTWLLEEKGEKYSFLFTMGCNTGLRVSDLLKLKVEDVKGKNVLRVISEKTDKELGVPLNAYIRSEIAKYTKTMDDKDFLFRSREGANKAVSRQMVSMVLKEVAEVFKLESFNTHSMRKTFGYWYYEATKDIYLLMKLFGHTSQTQTMIYIGVEEDELVQSLEHFKV